MATRPKKSQAKKPAKRKVSTAKMSQATVRETSTPKASAPALVNAVKPEEKLLATGTMDNAVSALEKSLKAALPAARAVNQKLVDIAQTNFNAGLELARDLAGARTPMEAMRLQMNYWHENAGVFQSQAAELRTLSAALLTTASEPIRAHIRRT